MRHLKSLLSHGNFLASKETHFGMPNYDGSLHMNIHFIHMSKATMASISVNNTARGVVIHARQNSVEKVEHTHLDPGKFT